VQTPSSPESRSMRVDAGRSPLKYASPHRSPLSPSRRILNTPRYSRSLLAALPCQLSDTTQEEAHLV
jgi:hypothetical protein